MTDKRAKSKNRRRRQRVTMPEVVVSLLVGAIIVVLAIPHILSVRQLQRFSQFQEKMTSGLGEARTQAMNQKKAVTFRFDERTGRAFIWGGTFGPVGDSRNRTIDLAVEDLDPADVKFGQPTGISVDRLADTTRPAKAVSGHVDFTFQPDGTMIDENKYPDNRAIFFYHDKYRMNSAFAVTVLGATGRVKSFKYRASAGDYIE